MLENISLNSTNVTFRNESNLPVYQIEIKDGASYYLRNQNSFDLISNIDKLLFLKSADFNVITNPKFKVPSADFLIKSNVVANNFIIINRKQSPNPGVYWSWLPYEYSTDSQTIYDQWSGGDKNYLMLTDLFLKDIPRQSDLNRYSRHMGSIVNNGRTDYNLVLRSKLSFARSDFEKLDSIEVLPVLNNYEEINKISEYTIKPINNSSPTSLISPAIKNQKSTKQKSQVSKESIIFKPTHYVSDPDGWTSFRDAPRGKILNRINNKTECKVLYNENGWMSVELENGYKGYIHSSRLKLIN